MLKQLKSRDLDNGERRWFTDDYFDLIIWSSIDGIKGFQLCYDKRDSERAVTWFAESGFIHERIDDGEADPGKNRSPVLIPDGLCPVNDVSQNFSTRSIGIDREIRSFVEAKLQEYATELKGRKESE